MSKIVTGEEWLDGELKRAPPPFVGMLFAPRKKEKRYREHKIAKRDIAMQGRQEEIDFFVRSELTRAGFVEGNVSSCQDVVSGDWIFTQEIMEDENEQTTEWIDETV